jgi:hypothetical protein
MHNKLGGCLSWEFSVCECKILQLMPLQGYVVEGGPGKDCRRIGCSEQFENKPGIEDCNGQLSAHESSKICVCVCVRVCVYI